MNIIYSAVSIWMLIVWVVGAIVITGFLIVQALSIYDRLTSKWAQGLVSHIGTHVWLFRAMWAWERSGHRRPETIDLLDDQEAIEKLLREVLETAMEHGYVITVENKPRMPLAMGNHYMALQVRPARNRYQEGGTQ